MMNTIFRPDCWSLARPGLSPFNLQFSMSMSEFSKEPPATPDHPRTSAIYSCLRCLLEILDRLPAGDRSTGHSLTLSRDHGLFHSESHIFARAPGPVPALPNPPLLPTHSTSPRAYSIGTPPPRSGILQTPVFICALRNNRPPSPAPIRSSSFAAAIALYWRSSSNWRAAFCLARNSCHARWMVQCRRARLRENRSGRGVRVAGWWRK